MVKKSKNILPKVKRKLKNFLTDESGKIAKKDALGLSLGSALLLGISSPEVSAAHSSSSSHSNTQCSHASQAHGSGYNRGTHISGTTDSTVNVSAVNGHYSGTPSGGGHSSGYALGSHSSQAAVNTGLHCNTSSHSSHGSHSNHSNY